jgi:hypothetical protein
MTSRELDALSFREGLALKLCDEIRRELADAHAEQTAQLWAKLSPAALAHTPRVARAQPTPEEERNTQRDVADAISDLSEAIARCMSKCLTRFDERTRRYERAVALQHRRMLHETLERTLEPRLAQLLRAGLEGRELLHLRPTLQYAPPTAIGSLEQPGLALVALPLHLTIGEEEQIVATECNATMHLVLHAFRSDDTPPSPIGTSTPGSPSWRGWLTAVESVGGGGTRPPTALAPAVHSAASAGFADAECSSMMSVRLDDDEALVSEWTVLDRAECSAGDTACHVPGAAAHDAGEAGRSGGLLSAAVRSRLAEVLHEMCRERVRRALAQQRAKHGDEVERRKEAAAGVAMVGGGLAFVGGSYVLGPAALVAGGWAGGSSKASAIVREAAVQAASWGTWLSGK